MTDIQDTNQPNLSKLDSLKDGPVSSEISATATPVDINDEGSTNPTSPEQFSSPAQGLDTVPETTDEAEVDNSQEIQAAQEYEARLNEELGLQMPDGLSEQDQDSWSVLFSRIRSMYSKGYIDKSYVYDMFETFDSLDSPGKLSALDNLYDFEERKDSEISAIEENLKLQERLDFVRNFALIFPQELRKEFLYAVENGETIDETVQKQLNNQIEANQDSVAYQRLQSYVGGGRNNLNNDKVLTVEDLVGKFDLDDTARSTQTYTTAPTRAPKPPQGEPKQAPTPPAPQSAAPAPQPVQPVPRPSQGNAGQQNQGAAASISHETKGLGDLLN